MKIWAILIIGLLFMPAALAASIRLESPTSSVIEGDQITIYAYIDAPEIIGFEFDLDYEETLLSFTEMNGLEGFVCINPTDNLGILEGIACYKTEPEPNSGRYVELIFQTLPGSNNGIARFIPLNQIITNSTMTAQDIGGYPQTQAWQTSVSISAVPYGQAVIQEAIRTDSLVNVTYSIVVDSALDGNFVPPNTYTGNSYWINNGQSTQAVPFSNGLLTLNLQPGTEYTLIQQVQTPNTIYGVETQNDNVMTKYFNLLSEDNFRGVFGNVSFNLSYPHIWLYQKINDEWFFKNLDYDFKWENNQVVFSDVEITSNTEEFYILGNVSCVNDWSAWSGCVNGIKTRTDSNYCTYPYTQTTTEGCDSDPPSSSGGGGGGGSAGGGSAREMNTITEYSGDVYETAVKYLGFFEREFGVSYETVNLGIGEPYKAFEIYLSSDRPFFGDEEVSEVKFKINVNEFWIENNNIEEIEVYKKEGTSWNKITKADLGEGNYEAYSNELGTFAVVGIIEEIEEQTPGIINPESANPEGDSANSESKSFDVKNFLLPIIIGLIVTVLIISAVVVNARHPKVHGTPKEVPKSKMEKVDQYIVKARDRGMSDEKIVSNLLAVGWTKEVVERAIVEANSLDLQKNKPAA